MGVNKICISKLVILLRFNLPEQGRNFYLFPVFFYLFLIITCKIYATVVAIYSLRVIKIMKRGYFINFQKNIL